MGRKKPEGLIHTLAQGERSVALGKDVHCANPERVQHRGTQEGKGRNLLCPFRARRIINRLPRAALRLPWASVCGILSGFFRTRIFRFLSWVSRCRTEPGYSNFSKPSREFGGCTPRRPKRRKRPPGIANLPIGAVMIRAAGSRLVWDGLSDLEGEEGAV
jgi:hypothetical protein